nr:hypothetical protein CFP56_58740 [Quercus suber]
MRFFDQQPLVAVMLPESVDLPAPHETTLARQTAVWRMSTSPGRGVYCRQASNRGVPSKPTVPTVARLQLDPSSTRPDKYSRSAFAGRGASKQARSLDPSVRSSEDRSPTYQEGPFLLFIHDAVPVIDPA